MARPDTGPVSPRPGGAKDRSAAVASRLIRDCRAAALGTLHDGAPAVSMVPYAMTDDVFAFLVLTSLLADHTRDMLATPDVALMIMQPEPADAPPHALARVSIRGRATMVPRESPRYPTASARYGARFSDMATLFEFGDFRLFAIEPVSVRVVAGFAQAASIAPEALWKALRG